MILKDEIYMQQALRLAREAEENGEVPIGAVVVKDGIIIGKGRNRTEALCDPTAHAEMDAITAATSTINAKMLEGATLYVTLEPCTMCAGALVLARIERVVFGASDPKAGALVSLYRLHDDPRLNHRFVITEGILEPECSELLTKFFKKLRKGNGK
ncbi:MAG: tRNA adenosine(34) deaminase TadA [Candidatus Electryonea clarkiae]|nr:tRNA adenosine(34) deaminase TadA [Candidatus Electryonea clarkiae]MDP8288173.1 tRNA adenosine(34) deaminase TadA [Candidatus Electryonea clarkiae]